jgi:hypothetical protein
MILKLIAVLLGVTVIFFGSFLAYVVFNPGQSRFFVTVFGIDPNQIANLLKLLINWSFGLVVLSLSIIWFIALFRAIWTPRELKRKKLLSAMTAILVGIILFSIIGFWAYLFKQIALEDFVNPDGDITIYDNTLYTNDITRNKARIFSTDNLIGPITLKFDISRNARQTEASNNFSINSYTLDFDGAICTSGTSQVEGKNPANEEGIICTFDKAKVYNIKGFYQGGNRTKDISEIPMTLAPIKLQ